MRTIPFALLMLVATLSACGQKGPLYLPQDNGAPVATGYSADNAQQAVIDQ